MISASNLGKAYGGKVVLQNFSITIDEGSFTTLLGPSGCGKTTLLRILAGLDSGFTGAVSGLTSRPAVVFQDQRLVPWLTVRQNIALVAPAGDADKAVAESLALTRLTGFADRFPQQLSGGQQQRVGLARALASRRSVLLLDEPFQGLDLELKLELIADLNTVMARQAMTTVMVTHDLDEALLVSDEVLVADGSPLVLTGRVEPGLPRTQRSLFDPRLAENRRRLYEMVTGRSIG